jgi:hypothetical protein
MGAHYGEGSSYVLADNACFETGASDSFARIAVAQVVSELASLRQTQGMGACHIVENFIARERFQSAPHASRRQHLLDGRGIVRRADQVKVVLAGGGLDRRERWRIDVRKDAPLQNGPRTDVHVGHHLNNEFARTVGSEPGADYGAGQGCRDGPRLTAWPQHHNARSAGGHPQRRVNTDPLARANPRWKRGEIGERVDGHNDQERTAILIDSARDATSTQCEPTRFFKPRG